jgi:TPR repeat protein
MIHPQPSSPFLHSVLFLSLFLVNGCQKPTEEPSEASQHEEAPAGEIGQDDPEAVYQQATQLLQQTNQPTALMLGFSLMRSAADSGHTRAQSIVGFELAQGEKKDLAAAVGYLSKAALAGDKFAAQNLRRLHDKFLENDPGQKPLVIAGLHEAADKGSIRAAGELAAMYYFGSADLPQSYAQALPLLQQAAEGGDAESANMLGVMYTEGLGVDKSDADGAKFFHLAAEANHAKAQASLGWGYAVGRGLPVDLIQAYKWLLLSTRQGEDTLADFIRGLSKDQIREGNRLVAEFLQTRGENVSTENLDEEIFNPSVPPVEDSMPNKVPAEEAPLKEGPKPDDRA